MDAAADIAIGAAPPAPPARPRTLLLGSGFAAAASVLALGAVLAVYLSQRSEMRLSGEWAKAVGDAIPTTPGTMALVTLAMSVVTMQWAVWALARQDRPRAYMAMGITFVLGLAYVNAVAFIFNEMQLTAHEFGGLLLMSLLGAHLAMTGVGLLFLLVMMVRTLGGDNASRHPEGLVAAAVYWYTTVAVFAVLWFVVFIEK